METRNYSGRHENRVIIILILIICSMEYSIVHETCWYFGSTWTSLQKRTRVTSREMSAEWIVLDIRADILWLAGHTQDMRLHNSFVDEGSFQLSVIEPFPKALQWLTSSTALLKLEDVGMLHIKYNNVGISINTLTKCILIHAYVQSRTDFSRELLKLWYVSYDRLVAGGANLHFGRLSNHFIYGRMTPS